VSIHEPAGGATLIVTWKSRRGFIKFQSTRLREARLDIFRYYMGLVSIHAPAGGATHKLEIMTPV
ncbi:hypothetical protein, partial [Pseudoalteromonas phenolica]|uniref:hypothetical protein n=1 Tax=Pseudoalteromonas phenolica TaxID=161398 RepID=UPI0012870EE2